MRTFLSRIVSLLYILSLFSFLQRIDSVSKTDSSLFYFNLLAYVALFVFSFKRLQQERILLVLFFTQCLILFFIILLRGTLSGASLVPFFSINLQSLICYGASLKRKDYLWIMISFLLFSLYFSAFNVMYLNTNNVGFIWLCIGIYIILLIPASNLLNYFFIGIVFVIISSFILMSESRSSLLAFGLFIIGKLMPLRFFTGKEKLYKLLCLMLTFGSLLYMQLYVFLFASNIDMNQIFSFFPSTKNFFSGRQVIWLEAFSQLFDKPLTGVGGVYELITSDLNELHNSIFCLFFYFGFIVATFILILINKILFDAYDYMKKNTYVKDGIFSFLAFLLLSFNENSLIAFSVCFLGLFIAYSEINKYKYIDQ